MGSVAESAARPPRRMPRTGRRVIRALEVTLLLYVFLVGVRALGRGFELLGGETVETFFRATENPFLGLGLGILATSIVQSSSVTTSLVVALVAAP